MVKCIKDETTKTKSRQFKKVLLDKEVARRGQFLFNWSELLRHLILHHANMTV